MCSEVREKQSIVVCLTSYETHECQKLLKERQKLVSKLCIESSRAESKHETSEQTLHRTERTKQAREPVKLASKPCTGQSTQSKRASETSEQTLHRTEHTKQAREPVKLASKPCIENSRTERTKQAREPMCIIAVLRRGFCTLVL